MKLFNFKVGNLNKVANTIELGAIPKRSKGINDGIVEFLFETDLCGYLNDVVPTIDLGKRTMINPNNFKWTDFKSKYNSIQEFTEANDKFKKERLQNI